LALIVLRAQQASPLIDFSAPHSHREAGKAPNASGSTGEDRHQAAPARPAPGLVTAVSATRPEQNGKVVQPAGLLRPRIETATVCERANLLVCKGFQCNLKDSNRFEPKEMTIAVQPKIAYEDLTDACLDEQLPRPGAVVKGPGGVAVEATRLNAGPETKCGLLTPPGCRDKWDRDHIGRPLDLDTATYIKRAYKVGHGNMGLLSDKQPPPPRKCASRVPKTLHYIWVGTRLLGPKHLQNVANSAVINPHWKIIMWLDRLPAPEELSFFKANPNVSSRPAGPITYSFIQDEAKNMRNWDILYHLNSTSLPNTIGAALSDILRLELLYLYGGVYLDIDIIFYNGFDEYGSLFWWPWVTHKVCGVNIANNAFGFDSRSAYLDYALNAFREGCKKYNRCTPYSGAGPPFMSITVLRYNSSDITMIGQQYFSASDTSGVSIMGHTNDKTWFYGKR